MGHHPRPPRPALELSPTLHFQNESGDFDSSKYDIFIGQLESNPSASEVQFLKILAEDYQIDQLNSVIEGPGYAVDAQVQLSLDARNTEYDLFNIKVDYETYNPEFEVTQEILKDYYLLNQAAYETEEKVDASYVLFKINSNIIAKFKDEELEAYYSENKDSVDALYRSTLEADSEELEEEITIDKVQAIVNAELLNQMQANVAENAANNFTYALYDQSIEYGSEAFESTKKKYVVKEIEIGPYSNSEIPQKGLSSELLKTGFDLNSEKYYSDPVKTKDGYAVLLYKGRTLPEIPTFFSVVDELASDYREAEKRKLFNEYGKTLKTEIEAIVQLENDFESSVSQLSDVTVEAYPNYSYYNRPDDVNPYELQAVFRLNPGEVSDMIKYGETAILTYLRSKTVIDYEADSEESTRLLESFKSFSRNTALNAFYTELMAIEISKDEEPASNSSE